jgi:hypothetical protein
MNNMGGQGFVTILEKKNIKLRFRVFGIWPLNLEAVVGKFGDVFIIAKEKEHKNSYDSNAIDEFNNDAKATTRLLSIARTFQTTLPIVPCMFDSPSSPMFCYYVEMPHSFVTPINNH